MKAQELKFRKILLAVLLAASILTLHARPAAAASVPDELKLRAKTVSMTSANLKWVKSTAVGRWRIRIAEWGENGYGKWKTVRTTGKGVSSCTLKKLKKNTSYRIELSAWVKKNGKWKSVMYDYGAFCTGLAQPDWSEYAHSDAYCSPTRIDLDFVEDDGTGFKPEGYLLYRSSDGGKKYEKIASLSPEKIKSVYKDKSVKKGETYRYKYRAWGKYKGQRIYSAYSSVLTRSAVWKNGKFSVQTMSQSADELIVRLQSDPYNGVLSIDKYDTLTPYTSEGEDWMDLPAAETCWSTDGKDWKPLPKPGKPLRVKGGDVLFLRLTPPAGLPEETGMDLSAAELLSAEEVDYDGLPSYIDINLKAGSGGTAMNMEMIH